MLNKSNIKLGRGLDALINPKAKEGIEEPLTISNKEIGIDNGKDFDILAKIPIHKIVPNQYQPRTEFEPEALNELKNSILENGLIQPITVRRVEGNYELISGERRFRACKEIGFKDIPAYIIKVDTIEGMLALALIENIQREELNPLEVAKAYQRLVIECNLSQEEIAQKVGKTRSAITNSIRLLKLPQIIQDSISQNEITFGHARALINVSNEEDRLSIFNKIKRNNLSVRQVEKLVRELSEGKREPKKNETEKLQPSERDIIIREDLEGKLRSIFATKVSCKQKKDGSGSIEINFYSNDELDRLFELFELLK